MATIYFTGKGDSGTTGILSQKRVKKYDPIIAAIGSVDELNSSIGVSMSYINNRTVTEQLRSIQNDLFIIGANLSSANGNKIGKAHIGAERIKNLEEFISYFSKKTPELKKFVLPGGDIGAAHLHLSRSISRRAERDTVLASATYKLDKNLIIYLNRLSSYLFAAAIYVNHICGVSEMHPTY